MATPSVLVFGPTGRIGGTLIHELLPDNAAGQLKLVAAVRRPEAAHAFEERGIEVRQIDLDDAETHGLNPLIDALGGIDRVLLLTSYTVRMLAQSKALIDAATVAGVSHIVHIGAYARPDTTIVHLGWHQLVEAYIERSKLRYTHLHPNTFMQNLLAATGPGRPGVITHYIGDARPSWIDCNDIAAVAAAVLREPAAHVGRVYPLATQAASIGEIASLLAEVTGLPWRYEPQDPDVFYRSAVAAGADPIYMACVRNVFERTRSGTIPEASDVFDTVERLIGRNPTSLRSFIERHRADFLYPRVA